MFGQLITVHQHNFGKVQLPPVGTNGINYSELTQVDIPMRPRGFAIKYVLEGTEHYQIQQKSYAVRAGSCLLLPPGARGSVGINSPEAVKGLCITIAPELLTEVSRSLVLPHEPQVIASPQHWEASPLADEHFLPVSDSKMSSFLQQLGTPLQASEAQAVSFSSEFYYRIAELYLGDCTNIYQSLGRINAARWATRKELYRRLVLGRSFMEDCFMQPVEIADIARSATMSEYQFFRLFKAVYGISPYQFILKKRLDMGYSMLKTGHYTVSEVALQTGFADIFSFSKAFKKRFGQNPSAQKN